MFYKEYEKTGKKFLHWVRWNAFQSFNEQRINAELLHYASAKGINYLEITPYYCKEQSEDIFGITFKNMPNSFNVSTKGSPNIFSNVKKAKDAVKKIPEKVGSF